MCITSFAIYSKYRRDSGPMAFKFIYILLLTSWFVFELDWRAVILTRSVLILHSDSQDKTYHQFNCSVNHYIMYMIVVCLICSMQFFVISIVTNRDITETNSLNFKIYLGSECLGDILIFAFNIAVSDYSRLIKIKDTKYTLSYTYHSEVCIENWKLRNTPLFPEISRKQ